MPTLQLEVEFKGLTAFAEDPGAPAIHALLPSTSLHVHHGHSGGIPQHTALFLAAIEEIARESDPPDFVVSIPGDQHFGCFRISNEDLQLDYSRVTPNTPIDFPRSLTLTGDPKNPDAPQQPGDWQDRSWLPDMHRVLPNRPVKIASSCFEAARPPIVEARWPLRFGQLRCLKPENAASLALPFHFEAPGKGAVPGINQVFSDRVRYAVVFDDTQVSLSIGTRRVVLKDSKADGVIRTVFSHLPNVQNNPAVAPDEHFSLYYTLLQDPPPADERPLPTLSARPAGGSPTSVDCYGCYISR